MADNRGEGGPFALCSLLTGQTSRLGYRTKLFVSIVSILAACLLIGDGALTPAVSILSAIEGFTVAKPSLSSWTVRISVIMIIVLFLLQRWGSSRIGILFGPIMIVWFLVLSITGIWRITFKPVILKSFNPWEAMNYLIRTKLTGFYQIGSIFLSVTGLEALYADLGHFGRWPVRFSWFAFVFPSVVLNYLGQGALLIIRPDFIDNPLVDDEILVCPRNDVFLSFQILSFGSRLVSLASAHSLCSLSDYRVTSRHHRKLLISFSSRGYWFLCSIQSGSHISIDHQSYLCSRGKLLPLGINTSSDSRLPNEFAIDWRLRCHCLQCYDHNNCSLHDGHAMDLVQTDLVDCCLRNISNC